MDVYLFSILLIVAVVLLLLTFFKKQVIIGVFAAIFFLLLGVICWTGISYISSTTITLSGSVYTVVNNYNNWSNPIVAGFNDNQIVGSCFVLFGLFLLIVSGVTGFGGKDQLELDTKQSSSSEGDEDGF